MEPDEQVCAGIAPVTLQAVGICSASQYDAEAPRLEVGMLLKPEARGELRGGAYGFDQTNLVVSPGNEIWRGFPQKTRRTIS
jgi:hypothetical protein